MAAIILTALIVLRGTLCGADVYGAFLRGAGQGARTAWRLLPALCAMLCMIGAAEASGLADSLAGALRPLLALLRLPEGTAPVLLLRPLTGSGSLSALSDILTRYGPDSRTGRIASVLMGSSETIFYTLTVYLAPTGVKRLRWVVPVSLASYFAGAAAAGWLL